MLKHYLPSRQSPSRANPEERSDDGKRLNSPIDLVYRSDGIKADKGENVFVSGPGGLWILSPEGKHLGTSRGPEHPRNMAWGDADKRAPYLAAQTGICRIRLNTLGIIPFSK